MQDCRERPLPTAADMVFCLWNKTRFSERGDVLMKRLVLETTAPFQGLPELVADREGLFAKEGLEIEWVERESDDKSTHVNVNTPKGLNPFSSHGKMLEQGKADMYN